ncbi:type II secretion system protein [Rhodopirellula bahusiensis]|uniref:type II secretion system protein n=1 Tax=Rhodopirellula bahusiensis TaxID=2014065 RepID=UPI003267E088
MKPPWRNALTLLELIVSLGILAVLSTVAVRSLDPIADQSRYEATQRVLEELRNATIGDATSRQNNGQRLIEGYVADTGSLPSDLDDFLTVPVGISSHSIQSFDSNNDAVDDVQLSSGWRGPYVQLGAGQTSILDGWGRELLVVPGVGTLDFTSNGSDGNSSLPEDGYAADLTVTISDSEYTSDATLRLFDIDGTTSTRIDPAPTGLEQLGVLLYCVNGDGGTSGAIEEVMIPVASSGTFEATKTDIVHGPAAARGILWSDTDSDDVFDVGESIIRSSYVHYFTITSDSDVRIEMELR